MIKHGFLGFCVSVLLLGILSFSSVIGAVSVTNEILSAPKSSSLIFFGKKEYAKYELIIGKMEYVEGVNSEGFKPTEKLQLLGTIDRHLYDYSKQKSAIQIYKSALAWLERKHYRILYQCSGEACGNVAGWRLFLTDKLGGDTSFQHYIVATKEGAGGTSRYVVLYVNDLAGQPRALLDLVVVSRSSGRNEINGDTNKVSIYFDFEKSSLVEHAEQLASAKQFVESHLGECPIQVIGYTDPIGGDASNKALAKARVDTVIHYLREIKGLTSNCLVSEPRGIESWVIAGEHALSRRVDLEVARDNN